MAGVGDVDSFNIANFLMNSIVYNSATSPDPSNAVISYGAENTITLSNVAHGALDTDDFIF